MKVKISFYAKLNPDSYFVTYLEGFYILYFDLPITRWAMGGGQNSISREMYMG